MSSTINKTNIIIDESRKMTKTKKKTLKSLKKRLLKKRLNKIIGNLYKGFNCKYVSVGTIYLEGFLEELKELSNKFKSLLPIYEKTNKFFLEYINTWNLQMESYHKDLIPLTSNIIESKNSIFKAFSKKSKSYSKRNLKSYYCAVALYENFDIKKRGKNYGTNAMMRAEVDMIEFGAFDFFEAVGIKENFGFEKLINFKGLINKTGGSTKVA